MIEIVAIITLRCDQPGCIAILLAPILITNPEQDMCMHLHELPAQSLAVAVNQGWQTQSRKPTSAEDEIGSYRIESSIIEATFCIEHRRDTPIGLRRIKGGPIE